jgi:hypothetical protein
MEPDIAHGYQRVGIVCPRRSVQDPLEFFLKRQINQSHASILMFNFPYLRRAPLHFGQMKIANERPRIRIVIAKNNCFVILYNFTSNSGTGIITVLFLQFWSVNTVFT